MSEQMIAGRYRLESHVGRGAHGDVWRATDVATRSAVAVKLLLAERTADTARARREVGVLRLLRLPGVVRLLDDGMHGDRAFLVMEWIEGTPFPGPLASREWSQLAPRALALLEILAQVHAAGIVHRDLKPANVLVDDSGRTTLLDFSISHFAESSRNDITAEGQWHGTPTYLAPEQLLGDPASASADIYAVGVMLYEALTGAVPALSTRARIVSRIPSLQGNVSAPSSVTATIDQMLASDTNARPSSAREASSSLRDGAPSPSSKTHWLGSRGEIDRAIGALLQGRAVDVAGAAGMGRSRFLNEVESILNAARKPTARLSASTRPFGSLQAVMPFLGGHSHASFEQISELIASRVRDFLSAATIVADDVHRVDPQTLRLLDEFGDAIPYLRATPTPDKHRVCIELRPLDELVLRDLFDGTDRLLHEREDAARALWRRTAGVPRRVFEELGSWVYAGIARPLETRFVVSRESLDYLETGLSVTGGAAASGKAAADLSPSALEVSAWLQLAGPSSADLLVKLTRLDKWELDVALLELSTRGLTRTREAALVEHAIEFPLGMVWSSHRIAEARSELVRALPPGTLRRLQFMLALPACDPGALVDEGVAAANLLIADARWGQATTVLEEMARVLRSEHCVDAELGGHRAAVFGAWTALVCAEVTPRGAERLLYELSRIPRSTELLDRLTELARATLELSSDPSRALSRAGDLPPFDDVNLEIARSNVRILGARSVSEQQEAEVVINVGHWAATCEDPIARVRLLGWNGRLAYRQGLYAKAAALQVDAAKSVKTPFERIVALSNAASSLLEAFEHEGALSHVEEARHLLAPFRHPHLEARLEWLDRAANYRLGRELTADIELVEAVEKVGLSFMIPIIRMTEAAIAWRTGQTALAAALASAAAERWATLRLFPEMGLLAKCLAIVAAGQPPDGLARNLARQAESIRAPGVGLQMLGLLSLLDPSLAESSARERARLAAAIAPSNWDKRMDILTTREAREARVLNAKRESLAPQPQPGSARRIPVH